MDKEQELEKLLKKYRETMDLRGNHDKLKIASLEGQMDLINEEFYAAYAEGDEEVLEKNDEERATLRTDIKDCLASIQNETIALEELLKELQKLKES